MYNFVLSDINIIEKNLEGNQYMNYKQIQQKLNEISNTSFHMLGLDALEDLLTDLEELSETADTLNETDESDGEYSEIMEEIEDLMYTIDQEMDALEDPDFY